MREIKSIHISQDGIQVGNPCWELYCLEHGIHFYGMMLIDNTVGLAHDAFNTFFSKTGARKHVPRADFVDLEPNCYLRSPYRNLSAAFPSRAAYLWKKDVANNFVSGHYTGLQLGKRLWVEKGICNGI